MKVVLLGTGTPNAEPWANGAGYGVIVNGKLYVVDAGPGIVRACTKLFYQGVEETRPQNLRFVFLTHLHSDHTLGLPDFLLTPWVLERKPPVMVFGPEGTESMVRHILAAYESDTGFRSGGPEPTGPEGLDIRVTNIQEGTVYQDKDVKVSAFRTEHGTLESYGFVFEAEGKKAVFSGDTCPLEKMKVIAKDADLLVHEAEYTAGLQERTPEWQNYHRKTHTMSVDLAEIIAAARPKKTVTTHRILHLSFFEDRPVDIAEIQRREELLLNEIRDRTDCKVINGYDLDIFEV